MNRIGNLAALGLSQVLRFGAAFLVGILLARWLSAEGFGQFRFLSGVVAVFAFGANLGLHLLLGREIAREPEAARVQAGEGIATTALLSVGTGGLVMLYVGLSDPRPEVLVAAALASVALALRVMGLVPQAVFQGLRRMELQVPGVLAGRAVYVVGTAALVIAGFGVVGVFAAQAAAMGVTLAVLLWALKEAPGDRAALRLRPSADLARRSVPFGLNLFFSALYLQVDVLILNETHGDHEVGIYSAAALLILQLPVLAQILNGGLYPRMARHLGDPAAAGEELGFALRVLLAVSLPVALGGAIVAEPLLVWLLGETYREGALALLIMLPLLPLRFANNGIGMALSALNRQPDRTRAVAVAAVFNLLSNLVVIPRYGAEGAAATTLFTEVVLTAWLAWRLQGVADGLGLAGTTARIALPLAVMGAVVWAVPGHVLIQVSLGAAVFAGASYLAGVWTIDDLRRLRRI